MIFLTLSIIFSAYLVLSFKVFERLNINSFHAIVVNYLACVITGSFLNNSLPDYNAFIKADWFIYSAILGISFIIFFNVMSIITMKQGATVTSVANKLSMVIPVMLSFYLYDDKINTLKILGILISLIAVVCTSLKEDSNKHQLKLSSLFLPILLFIGSGMNDTLIKFAQVNHIADENNRNGFNICIFSVSFFAGFMFMLYDIFILKNRFEFKSIIAGIALGIPNYFSMYFLLKTLALPGWNSSTIFPINNIGIVSLTSLLALIIFKEHLSKLNWVGLFLAFIAIIIMFFSA